jgi:2'-5' RNA ligase
MYDFFIGIRLPKELEEVCENYRRTFKAPRTVAHITVIPPFAWEEGAETLQELLKEALQPR